MGYYENGGPIFTHSQRRKARREQDLSAFSRREILNMVADVDAEDGLVRFKDHKNKKVQRALRRREMAFAVQTHVPQELSVSSEGAEDAVPESVSLTNSSEFDTLVQKFRAQGSANPERSARASLAARAGAAKRRQQHAE